MLEQLFGSASRAKIIKMFCVHPDEQYFVRELSRLLDIRLNALSRELANLEQMGLLSTEISKSKKYYRLNTSFLLYEELRALILKSVVLLEKHIVSALNDVKGVQVLILTGIFVNQSTDTDILIVGTADRKKVQKLIKALSSSFFQDIRFTLLKPAEYQYRLDVTDRFVYRILNSSPIIVSNRYAR